MLKFSSFDENSFLELAPNELKAKIHITKPLEINISKTKISLTLVTTKGNIIQNYPLYIYAVKTLPAENGWLNSLAERTEYELVFTEEAINNLIIIQDKMRAEKPSGFEFAVNVNFKEVFKEPKNVKFSIFLKLSESTDYITLFDNAPMEPE